MLAVGGKDLRIITLKPNDDKKDARGRKRMKKRRLFTKERKIVKIYL